MHTTPNSYFDDLVQTINRMPLSTVDQIVQALMQAHDLGQRIYLFGNGGSAALASHFACDLAKGTVDNLKKRFQVLALTDNVPLITAWANDERYEDIFIEQLRNFVRRDDIAFAISGSGRSLNVLKALRLARQEGALTIGLTGFQGGEMKNLCDLCLVVPSNNMQIIEDLHLSVTHSVMTAIRARICQRKSAAIA